MRLVIAGPKGSDGRPMGSKCSLGCRKPKGSEAHCSVCHGAFSGPSYFDEHRREGFCHNPAGLGLVLEDGLWATLEGHVQRREAGERMAIARAGRSAK